MRSPVEDKGGLGGGLGVCGASQSASAASTSCIEHSRNSAGNEICGRFRVSQSHNSKGTRASPYLEEDVLLQKAKRSASAPHVRVRNVRAHHDVGSVGALELERLALEEDVVEAPGRDREDGGDAHLAALDEEREVYGATARVSGGPRLAGSGVGRVAVRAETLAVDEDLRDDIDRLVAREAEELRHNGGGCELDEHDVVEADAVERDRKSVV